MGHAFITARSLIKIHRTPEQEVVALQGLDLEVQRGEFIALVGPSGAGKSTVLNVIGGLERISAGRLLVDGIDLVQASIAQLAAYRRRHVGFVWQQTTGNLLPYLSARANVALLAGLAGMAAGEVRGWAAELLTAVGLTDHADRSPAELSGGQQQRAAIACALAARPSLLLGDEPTGEVDWPTAQRILTLFADLRLRFGTTIVIVTHDARVAAAADRVIAIHDGRVSHETLAADGIAAAVIDSVGRLQLPPTVRMQARLGRRVTVTPGSDGLLLRPLDAAAPIAAPQVDQRELAAALYGMAG